MSIAVAVAMTLGLGLPATPRDDYVAERERYVYVELPAQDAENQRMAMVLEEKRTRLRIQEGHRMRIADALAAHRRLLADLDVVAKQGRDATARHLAWGPHFAAEVATMSAPWASIRGREALDTAWRDLAGLEGDAEAAAALDRADQAATEHLTAVRDRALDAAAQAVGAGTTDVDLLPATAPHRAALRAVATSLATLAADAEAQRSAVASLRHQRRKYRHDLLAAGRAALHRRRTNMLVATGTDLLAQTRPDAPIWSTVEHARQEFAADVEKMQRMSRRRACRDLRRALRVAHHRMHVLEPRVMDQSWPLALRRDLTELLNDQRTRLAGIGAALALRKGGPSCR